MKSGESGGSDVKSGGGGSAQTRHLGTNAEEALDLGVEARVAMMQGQRWIGYTQAKRVLERLEDLLNHPKTHRMPNLLLVGETNNGKTMIVRRFAQLHPGSDNPNADGAVAPVIVVQAPPVPDEGRFYSAILEEVWAPYSPNQSAARKQHQVLAVFRCLGVKMLVIDEIQHVLAGHAAKQRAFLNVIKHLGNELQIPIVGVGTQDAVRAIQTDPQLANRFQPVALPKWQLNKDFLQLLASFERMLPLAKPSHLPSRNLAPKLLALSEGVIGELSTLLVEAAVYAVRTGQEQINSKIIAALDWTAPSRRRAHVERIV